MSRKLKNCPVCICPLYKEPRTILGFVSWNCHNHCFIMSFDGGKIFGAGRSLFVDRKEYRFYTQGMEAFVHLIKPTLGKQVALNKKINLYTVSSECLEKHIKYLSF